MDRARDQAPPIRPPAKACACTGRRRGRMTDSIASPDKVRAWIADPVLFVREQFGAAPDPWQEQVLRAFPGRQRLAMKACKGPGKTTVEAWLAWNFLATRSDPKIAATSVSGDNLADNLWSE